VQRHHERQMKIGLEAFAIVVVKDQSC